MSIAFKPGCLGFSTSRASMMAPAQVPKVGLLWTNSIERFVRALAEQLQKRARLATGNHQPVDALEVFRIADEHDLGPQLFQPAAVRVEISLQGKNTDLHDIWL